MTAATKLDSISEADYLASERDSRFKREYVDGFVYAMAGAKTSHNIVAMNAGTLVHVQLWGKRCRPFNSDMKIRVKVSGRVRYYYPDLSVVCGPFRKGSFQDKPVVILETLSEGTRRIDEGEKKDAYLSMPSLRVYLLAEQDMPRVVAYRRKGKGFVREIYEGVDAVVPLSEIEAELPLAKLYDGVEFRPEPEDEEDAAEV